MTEPTLVGACRTVALGVLGLLIGMLDLGCATAPPPLSPPVGRDWPEAWRIELAAAPQPPVFAARVRMRLDAPGEPGVQVEGNLQAGLPDTLRLQARMGVFRPLFALTARADSAALLIHEEKTAWLTSRVNEDWEIVNPSAFARALSWALSPQSLWSELEIVESRMLESGRWEVVGRIENPERLVRLVVDPQQRRVESLDLVATAHQHPSEPIAHLELRRYRDFEGAWIPLRFKADLPHPEGRLTVSGDLQGIQGIGRTEIGSLKLLRPEGWSLAGDEPLSIPIPK